MEVQTTDRCKKCGEQYGQRRRCYKCGSASRRLGEDRTCEVCGKSFYCPRHQLNSARFNGGRFCSVECTHKWKKSWSPTGGANFLSSSGYVLAHAPGHKRSTRGRVFEHILVMEKQLGRPLQPGEYVHHIDHDKTNNSPENLLLTNHSEHAKLHWREKKESGWTPKPPLEKQCPTCREEFRVPFSKRAQVYCSRRCARRFHLTED